MRNISLEASREEEEMSEKIWEVSLCVLVGTGFHGQKRWYQCLQFDGLVRVPGSQYASAKTLTGRAFWGRHQLRSFPVISLLRTHRWKNAFTKGKQRGAYFVSKNWIVRRDWRCFVNFRMS